MAAVAVGAAVVVDMEAVATDIAEVEVAERLSDRRGTMRAAIARMVVVGGALRHRVATGARAAGTRVRPSRSRPLESTCTG